MFSPSEGIGLGCAPLPSFNHTWAAIAANPGTWRCTSCGTVANTGLPTTPVLQGCRGWSIVLGKVGRGHRLVRYPPHPDIPDQSPCVACEECHRTATSKPVFADVCVGNPTAARTRGYRRLELGKHPHPRWGDEVCFSAGQWYPAKVTGDGESMVQAGDPSDGGATEPALPISASTSAV